MSRAGKARLAWCVLQHRFGNRATVAAALRDLVDWLEGINDGE